MASLLGQPLATGTNANGAPISGAKWHFYRTGSLIPASVYAEATLATPLSNPVTADSAGRFPDIYLDDAVTYRAILKDAGGSTIRDTDPVNPRSSTGSVRAEAFGVSTTGTGAANSAALAAAFATGKDVTVGDGDFHFASTIAPLFEGQKLTGAGRNRTRLIHDGTGWALSFANLRFCYASDFTLGASDEGIDYSCATGNCVFNIVERLFVSGPGRGATRTSTTTRGIRFGQMTGSYACFFNTVRDVQIEGFNTLHVFEAPVGDPTTGGNANHVINPHCQTYWTAFRFEGIECDVRHGFFNNSSGNSASDYTVAYHFTNGCSRNIVDAAIGEPGTNTYAYIFDAGTSLNYLTPGLALNYDLGGLDNGNNTPSATGRVYSGLAENANYAIQIATLSQNNTSLTGTISYSSRNAAIGSNASGTVTFEARRAASASALTVEFKQHTVQRSGNGMAVLAGYQVGTSGDIYLVFSVSNNGTGSTGTLSLSIDGQSGAADGLTLDASASAVGAPGVGFTVPNSAGVNLIGNVGFNGTGAVAKIDITGSRAGNAALADLLTKLATTGLITNSTTA